jgi:hypothetical protein
MEDLEKKKVEKVISGTAKTKKKTTAQKIAEAFVPEDVTNIGDYLLHDIFVPSAKKLFEELVTNGISILLYGDAGRGKKNGRASKVSYRDYYENNSTSYRGNSSTRAHARYDYEDIVLDSRGEAEDVLDRMCELVAAYGMASVADLYDLVGITGNYTDNKYGWTDLRTACVDRVRDGYLIKMPRIVPLN